MLALENIAKSYPRFSWGIWPQKDTTLYENLNLNLAANKIYGLRGPNGKGKTTLLKILAGLILEDGGTIVLNGKKMSEEERMTQAIYLAQSERNLFWRLTGRQNLIFFSEFTSCGQDKIDTVIAELDLKNTIDRPVSTYSHGQMQLTSLARCFLKDWGVYLFDEPFVALDTAHVKLVKTIIRNLKNPTHHILITSHDETHLNDICDEVIDV
jgi:ABC-2 type transport system ATP-binding protein